MAPKLSKKRKLRRLILEKNTFKVVIESVAKGSQTSEEVKLLCWLIIRYIYFTQKVW